MVRPRPATKKPSRGAAKKTAPARARTRRRRPRLRIPLAAPGRRLHVLLIVIGMALSLCAGRLIQLQGFDSSSYPVDALTRTLSLLPARGQITDRNGLVLAATQPAVAVTADPSLTAPRALEIAAVLSSHLGMSTTELMPLLTKPRSRFVYIKKKVPALTYTELATELAKRKVYGVFRENDPIRTYPNSSIGSSVVGFVGADGRGLAGLELKLNASLAGVEGKQTFQSAPNGSKIPLGESSMTPAQNGVSYQLTLDSEIEWAAQRRVAEMVRKTKADSGFVIVLDVKTGQVLALAHAPSYDSARPQAAKPEDRGNRAVSAPYEPGSVQKILTAAALFDSGTATPTSRVVVPNRLASGGRTIKDHFSHDRLRYNLRGVIANSSNIGAALLTRQLSKQALHDYLVSFGLGSRTGIELPGESVGIVPPADMPDGQRDQVAFGQAISVTGIQEAAAIAGLVNGGIYNPPTVLKKAYDADGREIAYRAAAAAPDHLREELGPGPRCHGGGDRQRQWAAQSQPGGLPQRRKDRDGAARRPEVPLLPGLCHFLRRFRPAGRPAAAHLRGHHQPADGRHRDDHRRTGLPGRDGHRPAALLRPARRQSARTAGHRVVTAFLVGGSKGGRPPLLDPERPSRPDHNH